MASKVQPKNTKTATSGGNARGANQGQVNQQAASRPMITKPMLPGTYERMLRRQGADQMLDHIQVRFYPRGLQEIAFCVRNPETDELTVLSPGEYQVFRNKLEPVLNQHKENEAAANFFKKLEARCWIKTNDHSPANARRVKGLTWPTPVLSAFQLTQKDIKSKKLTPTRMFSIWKERNEAERAIISKFQREVDPGYDWVETLAAYSLFMERTKREEEERKKEKIKKDQVVLPDQNWGDVEDAFAGDEKLPFTSVKPNVGAEDLHDPFANYHGEENDEGGSADPLDRALSPKPEVVDPKGDPAKSNPRGGVSKVLDTVFNRKSGKGTPDPKGEEVL